VIHLALAPKSNSTAKAIWSATEAVQTRRAGPVPIHLRDSSYRSARILGHGKGYVYPHDSPEGWVPQEHLPVEVAGERFYLPSTHGAEPSIAAAHDARHASRGDTIRAPGGAEGADDDE
jgi:putative ATPase